MRPRLAPSDVRSATSRARAAAPTRSRLPALVAATAITTSPATMNGRQPRRAAAPPSRRSLSGSRRSRVPALVAGKRRARSAAMASRSAAASARPAPGASRPKTRSVRTSRPALAGGVASGRNIAAALGSPERSETTPTTVAAAPSTRTWRPITAASRWYRLRHSRSVRTTAGGVPGVSSSVVMVRPARAATPVIANALADSAVASTRSGGAIVVAQRHRGGRVRRQVLEGALGPSEIGQVAGRQPAIGAARIDRGDGEDPIGRGDRQAADQVRIGQGEEQVAHAQADGEHRDHGGAEHPIAHHPAAREAQVLEERVEPRPAALHGRSCVSPRSLRPVLLKVNRRRHRAARR